MRPPIESFTEKDLESIALLDVVCKDVVDRESLFTSNVYEYQSEEQSEEDNSYQAEATSFMFGTTLKGHSVALYIRNYMPTLRYEIQGTFGHEQVKERLQSEIPNFIYQKLKIRFQKLKRFYGYIPDESNPLQAKTFR